MPVDIVEYSTLARDQNSTTFPAGREPAVAVQQVAVTVSSVACANPFSGETRMVRVHTDSTCRIAFGSEPTAGISSMRLSANATEYFGVIPGHKIAVIQST